MSANFPVTVIPDLSPLGQYFIHPDWLPDESQPEKRLAVMAARRCGESQFQLIHYLTDPQREDQYTDLFREIKNRPDGLPMLRAALLVELAWERRFFAMNALEENIRALENKAEREATVEALAETVPDPTEDEEPGPEEELDEPAAPETSARWYVITDGDFHILHYAGKPTESKLRGHYGLETLERMARQFNASGALPGRKRRARTAIDAPCPETFNRRHADSPPLPLEIHPEQPKPTMSAKKKAAPETETDPAPVIDLIPASQFVRYPTNRVPDPEAIKGMTASIREIGVLQPILARPIDDGAGGMNLQVIFGETRWRGCQGIDPNYPVPCRIRHLDDREAAKIHAIENFQRKDLTEIEEAREIQHLLDVGWNFDEIKDHVGRAKDWLYRRLNLLKLPEQGQLAIIEGNLSILTAAKIVSLPEEMREQAVKAVVEPTHAARALPERDALQVLDRNFVKPWEEEQAWNEKRKLLEKENPGCKWMTYREAKAASHWESDFERADEVPGWAVLSDAARNDEMRVPEWKELAEKHGAEIYIGFTMSGETTLYVKTDAIIEAERLACAKKPADCLFNSGESHSPSKAESEALAANRARREAEAKAKMEALYEERVRFARMLLLDQGITKTATKKICELAYREALTMDMGTESLLSILQIEAPEHDTELRNQKRDVAFLKLLRAKDAIPFEVIGRLWLADLMCLGGYQNDVAKWAFDTGAVKPDAFPNLHEVYQEIVARRKDDDEDGREAA